MTEELLHWKTAEAQVNAFGVPVRVIGTGDESVDVIALLADAWKDSPQSHQSDIEPIEVDLGFIDRDAFDRLHSHMSTMVTLAALKYQRGSKLMFHAGGIAREDGQVALIAGPSGRGKTTTIRHLCQHYGYVSDETIALDPYGRVLPYRKPLSVISEGYKHKRQLASSELGLLPLPEQELHIGALVLLQRAEDGRTQSTVEDLPLGIGIAQLVEHSSYLAEMPDPLYQIAKLAGQTGGFKLLTVGAPERIAEVAEELFVPGQVPFWEQVLPDWQYMRLHEGAAFVPRKVLDAVECEDGTVIFTHDRTARLIGGLGPLLWRSACHGHNWTELVRHVEAEFGPPPSGDTRTVVSQIAEDLIGAGILARGVI